MSEDNLVKVKITYVQVLAPTNPFDDKVIKVNRDKIKLANDKQGFINLLLDSNIPFPLTNAVEHFSLFRLSKKRQGFVPLESVEDFNCLTRSLKVKNHIRLTINDRTPFVNESFASLAKPIDKSNVANIKTEGDDAADISEDMTITNTVMEEEEDRAVESAASPKSSTEVSESKGPENDAVADVIKSALGNSSNFSSIAKILADAMKEELTDTLAKFSTEILDSLVTKKNENYSSQTEAKPKRVVHDSACCDNCSPSTFTPIKGTRFKCLICPDFDLCQACEESFEENEIMTDKHSYLHPTMKVIDPSNYKVKKDVINRIPNDGIIHEFISCDRCSTGRGFIEGIRHKCLKCIDFDLCHNCYKAHKVNHETINSHNYLHDMVALDGSEGKFSSNSCNSSNYLNNARDVFFDFNLDNCSSGLGNKIKSMLSNGLPNFSNNLEELFKNADRYNELIKSIDKTGDDEVDFAILCSLITDQWNESKKQLKDQETEEMVTEKLSEEQASETDMKAYEHKEHSEIPNMESSVQNNDSEAVQDSEAESSNTVSLKLKRFGPQSKIFSVQLVNESSHFFPAGDMTFEFFDKENKSKKDCIVVRNASAIDSYKQRFYNLKGDVERFIGRQLKIYFNNDDYIMEGTFGSFESSLNILKSGKKLMPSSTSKDKHADLSGMSVNVSLKANGMAQLSIFNNTQELIDCSGLTIEVVNFLGNSICKVLVHKRHGIEPSKFAKFNVGLNSAHLKHPFYLNLTNKDFKATAELSLKKLSNEFRVKMFNYETEEPDEQSSSTETETEIGLEDFENEKQHANSNSIGSIDSMVLPSLPRESVGESKNSDSVYMDAEPELGTPTNVDDMMVVDNDEDRSNDHGVISEDDFELGSDYEILTPTISNNY